MDNNLTSSIIIGIEGINDLPVQKKDDSVRNGLAIF